MIMLRQFLINCLLRRHRRCTIYLPIVIMVLMVMLLVNYHVFINAPRPAVMKKVFSLLKIDDSEKKDLSKSSATHQTHSKDTSSTTTRSRLQRHQSINGLPQKCKIPLLDPYHPDVRPHIRRFTSSTCSHPKLTAVTDDGILKVKDLEKVLFAKFAYMERIDDDSQKFTDWIDFFDKNIGKNEQVKLERDVVKVSITPNDNTRHEEFHVYPTRKDQSGGERKAPKVENMNFVFIMMDSMSHSSAERYLMKTLKKLKGDQNTVIMNGHTIVGDGTTPNICAMFIGDLEKNLPEARKGYKGAGYVDRWPFIFKDFQQKKNYVTLLSEDSPPTATFNYRLHGFDKPPAVKYLRNYWLASESYVNKLKQDSMRCHHQIAFKYFQQFMNNYRDQPTFSFLIISDLPHMNSPGIQVADEDIFNLVESLETSGHFENTMFVLFGDHGDRSSAYRGTMTGKLEERLPFLSITLPEWFTKEYPDSFKNLRRNSDILTSHYDVYATLRHLMTFPENKYEHKYGKSLFTDIQKLNRTCAEAGVLNHWCSCVDYQPLKIDDPIVMRAAEAAVVFINSKIAKKPSTKEQCRELQLQRVIRAGTTTPNTDVQKFVNTFKNGDCDDCGVKQIKKKKFLNKVKEPMSYEIVFIVSPSNGQYEATVSYDSSKDTFLVSQGMSRINLYGKQPHCIQREFPYLRPFCFCKDQLQS